MRRMVAQYTRTPYLIHIIINNLCSTGIFAVCVLLLLSNSYELRCTKRCVAFDWNCVYGESMSRKQTTIWQKVEFKAIISFHRYFSSLLHASRECCIGCKLSHFHMGFSNHASNSANATNLNRAKQANSWSVWFSGTFFFWLLLIFFEWTKKCWFFVHFYRNSNNSISMVGFKVLNSFIYCSRQHHFGLNVAR